MEYELVKDGKVIEKADIGEDKDIDAFQNIDMSNDLYDKFEPFFDNKYTGWAAVYNNTMWEIRRLL